MKVLLVHNFYQSTHVGGEDLVFEQEKKALITALGENNIFTYSAANDNLNKFKLIFTIWHNFIHAKKIYNLIKKHNIHIMHVHNYFPLLTPGIFRAAKKAGAKVVYTLHNYREWCLSGLFYRPNKPDCYDCVDLQLPIPGIKHACYRGSKIQSLFAGLAYFYYKKTKHLNFVDRFFVLSDTQQKILQKIQTPIILKAKIKPSFIESLQAKNKLDLRDRKNYLFVGRLEEIKGIDILLEVWQKLDARFLLEIVGTGPSQQHLQQKYKNNDNIVFMGKLPRERVLIKMAQAKYVIHPGIVQETQGLTILEALAQGTPVIGFAIGTRKEYIQENYNGFLGNISNLEEMIINAEEIFTTKPDEYALLCEQAALSVKPHLPEAITLKQLELYHELCLEQNG
jgi:glycosyltransferase involved in cell wall biosynthesis